MMLPRDYQQECGDQNLRAYEEGLRRGLNALPTGSGKTNIAA